ncbi:LysB family phage lysis regulatory protein, partial [Yersinia enterocolitica]|nr:LysB family phage lysis regulatory protein [Yersinia enterocolitica]
MRIAMMVIVALLVALGWYANSVNHDIDSANRIIGTLSVGIESRDNAITRLQDEARQQADNERA